MKILHLMQHEKFTRSIAEFYNCYFNNGEHEILYINKEGKDSLINPLLTIKQTEVFLLGENRKEANALVKYLARCDYYDYIVLHSLFFTHYTLLFHPKVVKKIIWIAWGYDLYNWPPKGNGLQIKFAALIGKWIRNHCSGFVGIFPPDCDFFRKKFPNAKAKTYYAPYCGAKISEHYLNYSEISNLDRRKEDNEPIYIQIGHSAVRSIDHISTLDRLRHLKDENIRIFLPLSYGDMKYADEVEQYAKAKFGDKVICLREFMPRDEYYALVKRIDIAIFDTYRQIGLGNINAMVFGNVKIYMPQDSVMYQYYTANGVPVQKIEDLQSIAFDELKEPIKTSAPKAFQDYIDSLKNMERKVANWKAIYDDLKRSR